MIEGAIGRRKRLCYNKLQHEHVSHYDVQLPPDPGRFTGWKRGRKSGPKAATFCHFLTVIRGLKTTQGGAGRSRKSSQRNLLLDDSRRGLQNLMIAIGG